MIIEETEIYITLNAVILDITFLQDKIYKCVWFCQTMQNVTLLQDSDK